MSEVLKQGNLYGILLTGLGIECIELFQSYLHRTGDVQTPAVAIIHSTVAKTLTSKITNAWIERYRDLLDRWMLWTQRYTNALDDSILYRSLDIRCLRSSFRFILDASTILRETNMLSQKSSYAVDIVAITCRPRRELEITQNYLEQILYVVYRIYNILTFPVFKTIFSYN